MNTNTTEPAGVVSNAELGVLFVGEAYRQWLTQPAADAMRCVDTRAAFEAAWSAAVAAERERCIRIVETYQVPVGNSAAGEMAAEWTLQALREVRDEIRQPNATGNRPAPEGATRCTRKPVPALVRLTT